MVTHTRSRKLPPKYPPFWSAGGCGLIKAGAVPDLDFLRTYKAGRAE